MKQIVFRNPKCMKCHIGRIAIVLFMALLFLMGWDAAHLDLNGPPPSWLLLDRHGRFIAEIAKPGEEFGYWPVKKLPPRVVAAALALEDHRFMDHPGVDPLALFRALYQNATRGRRISGASTIAMQVARMLDPESRTYWHKAREAWHALVFTLRFGREAVLSAYLRLVPYGNRVHGIAYAAQRYLDKPVSDLSWAEIAFLSAIPKSPTRMNPFHEDGRRRAIARGARILERLKARGLMSNAEYQLAQEQLRNLHLPDELSRPEHAYHAVFKLAAVLQSSHPAGKNHYKVVTTLDLDMQQTVANMAAAAVDEWRSRGAGNAAVILLDRKSNGVLAWVGSTDYFDRKSHGSLDYAQIPRSPGSTLKPFIYALAYEENTITPATILDDLPSVSDGISNADRRYFGPLLPRQALANSRNIPAVRLLDKVGLDEGYEFMRRLGLHDNEHEAKFYGLGLAIGAMPVTLEHLVRAYSVLANDGTYRPLRWYSGEEMPAKRLLSPGTARLLTLELSDPSARLPSFPRMGSTEYAFPVALKTGSSQGLRDAWTVAYSKRYLVGVWIGHPDERPMRDLSGAGSAAVLAQEILNNLHGADRFGFADLSFPPPEGYQRASLCALSGKLATPDCDLVFEEWFKPGQMPHEKDDYHELLAIDVRNGLLAQAKTPKRDVEWRDFVKLPARYADWAYREGIPAPPDEVSTLGKGGAIVARRNQPELPTGVATLRIASPTEGLKLMRDPTVPAAFNTIALRVDVSPKLPQILWMVDGKPYQLATYPYTVRLPLSLGEHVIQARAPLSSEISQAIHIRVE